MTAQSSRLVSLDAFRGATIAGMILVNNPGTWDAVYPQLRHAAWHGWTFTDFIFPFFLWIVGVAMTFSFARRVGEGADKGKLLLHVVRRAAIIFGLGLFLNGFPFGLIGDREFALATIRIPGVLQRIAICYLIVGILLLHTGVRAQVRWLVGLLAGYWLVMKLVPVPGYGAGVLEPMGNLVWYVDSKLLAGHTWAYAPAPGFDPEGILSTIPAIGTTLFGVLTGHWLRSGRPREDLAGWMFVAGNLLLLLGAIMDMGLPINKNLWTSSYTVFMAGWALVCFATMFWLVDVKKFQGWAKPFVVYGMNAIAIYVFAGILARLLGIFTIAQADGTALSWKDWLMRSVFNPIASPMNASLLFAISFVLVTYLVAWVLWKNKIFIKV
jgi:predicted acyltransferase